MQVNALLFNQVFFNIQIIENSLKIFLGPTGKKALSCTKNGKLQQISNSLLLLKSLELEPYTVNILFKLFMHASLRSFTVSGNGATTNILLACNLLKNALKFLLCGYNPLIINNGLTKSMQFLTQKVLELAIPISTTEQIEGVFRTTLKKKVSLELSNLLSKSSASISRESAITIEENSSALNTLDIVQGVEIDQGFASPYFSNDVKLLEVIYENPLLLVAASPIHFMNQIQQIIEYVQAKNRPLIILVENVSDAVVSALILGTIKKKFRVVVIKYRAIKFVKTGLLEDISLLAHSSNHMEWQTKNINEEFNRTWHAAELGNLQKAVIKKEQSVFIFSKFSKIIASRRMNELNRELLSCQTGYEKSLFKARIARFSGSIIKIKIGTAPLNEIENDRQLLESAVHVLDSSLQEGIIPGGGVFYLRLKEELLHWSSFNLIGDEIFSSQIINDALLEVVNILFANMEAPNFFILLKKIANLGYPWGYHLVQKKFLNAAEAGLVDSAKSIRTSLWHSISIISTIIICK